MLVGEKKWLYIRMSFCTYCIMWKWESVTWEEIKVKCSEDAIFKKYMLKQEEIERLQENKWPIKKTVCWSGLVIQIEWDWIAKHKCIWRKNEWVENGKTEKLMVVWSWQQPNTNRWQLKEGKTICGHDQSMNSLQV